MWSQSGHRDNAEQPNQLQQAEDQCRALSDDVVGFAAELHKAVQTLGLLPPAGDKVLHLRGKDER